MKYLLFILENYLINFKSDINYVRKQMNKEEEYTLTQSIFNIIEEHDKCIKKNIYIDMKIKKNARLLCNSRNFIYKYQTYCIYSISFNFAP